MILLTFRLNVNPKKSECVNFNRLPLADFYLVWQWKLSGVFYVYKASFPLYHKDLFIDVKSNQIVIYLKKNVTHTNRSKLFKISTNCVS